MQIAQHLFEREQNGRDGRIERRRQRRRATHGQQIPHARFAQSEAPAQIRCDARADLYRRAFAAQRNAACQRDGATEKFPRRRRQRNVSVVDKDRELGLRNAAPARVRKESEQKNTRKCSDPATGDQHAPPWRSSRRDTCARQAGP